MPGPSPGMTAAGVLLVQQLVEVVPLRVQAVDEADLPGAGPVLDGLLALDGIADVLETLVVNETLQAVAGGEALDAPLPVLEHARGQVRRHADVKGAVAAVAHEVYPAALH